MNEWHKKFFNELYLNLFMKRTQDMIDKEVSLITSLFPMEEIQSIMDVCCGIGDLTNEISNRYRIRACGIEYSEDYIKNKVLKNIIHGDARENQTEEKFDLVLNWWSSFSYFNTTDNYKILENCYKYTNKYFILETANVFNIVRFFEPNIQYSKQFNNEVYQIDRISNINLVENKLEQKFVFHHNGITSEYDTESYLYTPKDMQEMLYNIGFKKVQILGKKENELMHLSLNAPRILIKAEK